jgi:hypothetical protein
VCFEGACEDVFEAMLGAMVEVQLEAAVEAWLVTRDSVTAFLCA